MTNKEKIFNALKELSSKIENSNRKGITSAEIADFLSIQRNVVSHHLNELHREGSVIKTNSRPVYFQYKMEADNIGKKGDVFDELIGSKGSLKKQVEQCKVAASYPNKGLPVILTGESGVGKSYIAQLIYDYAKQNGYINENAPFVIFNCAEYANNPELLTSKLFGYQKGAFTGANTDMPGLVEEASDGYLFLDEVHRLTPEGQEKLFLILDKGIYKRLGETGKWRKASLRLIFATTEDPEKILLETFLRRIPLNIKIPLFSERPLSERLNFIYKFYKDEALKLGWDIEISKQVVNALISMKLNGNIGKLINIVKYSCAYAYKENLYNKNSRIVVRLNSLPQESITYDNNFKKYNLEDMVISLKDEGFSYDNVLHNHNKINEMILKLAELAEDYNKSKQHASEIFKSSNLILNEIVDELIFNKEKCELQDFPNDLLEKSVESSLKIIENRYGIKYYGNTSNVLSKSLNYFCQNLYDSSKKEKRLFARSEEALKKALPRYYLVASKLLSLMELNIDYKFDSRAIIYLVYYLYSINSKSEPLINSIIIAHGYSTASSIASVANKLIGEFIFEAFDMPVEVSSEEITNKIKNYLQTVDTSKGLIILVDMGSLENMYKSLAGIVKNDIVIINNITTQIALDVGLKINQGCAIGEIVEGVDKWNKIRCQYIKYDDKKKNAILTTCISGLGTAIKLRDLLKECIDDENIEVMAYDFNRLKNNKENDKIFSEYNVLFIVGTSKLNIKEVPYMNIEDLITGKGEKILNSALKNKLTEGTIEELNINIVKKFSLENILDRLTILNPNKIVDQVERAISHIEVGINKKFNNNLKISLLIHISCLIERLIVKDEIGVISGYESFVEEHEEFINLIRTSFSEISRIYRVEMPIGEIQIMYQIINNI